MKSRSRRGEEESKAREGSAVGLLPQPVARYGFTRVLRELLRRSEPDLSAGCLLSPFSLIFLPFLVNFS